MQSWKMVAMNHPRRIYTSDTYLLKQDRIYWSFIVISLARRYFSISFEELIFFKENHCGFFWENATWL